MTDEQRELPPCSTCGGRAWKYSSGRPECGACWQWRKLDGPAARHWARVTTEFLSNVDRYDLITYLPACGLSNDEITAVLNGASKILEHSREALKAHGEGGTEEAMQ